MFHLIKEYLTQRGWQFSKIDDKQVLTFGISGKNGTFDCIVDVIDGDTEKKVMFLSICSSNVPPEKRAIMFEVINAINFGLFFGNFEMDPQDGQIRFKTSSIYTTFTPTLDFINQLIMMNIITMDRSLPAIMAVLYQEATVMDAVRITEEQEKIFFGS